MQIMRLENEKAAAPVKSIKLVFVQQRSVNMRIGHLKLFLPLFLWLNVSASVVAQEQVTQVPVVIPVAAEAGPEDALDRGTPRGSISGFLDASSQFDFDMAAQYLDLRNLPKEVDELGGHELARQLNHVLSRAVWLDDYTVSDSPEGLKGDGLPDYRDELVVIKTQDGDVPLWMQKVPRGDGEDIWKVSNRSVALVPELYDEFSYPDWIEKVRNTIPVDASFLGIEAFKWLIVIGFVLASWPVLYGLSRLFLLVFSST